MTNNILMLIMRFLVKGMAEGCKGQPHNYALPLLSE